MKHVVLYGHLTAVTAVLHRTKRVHSTCCMLNNDSHPVHLEHRYTDRCVGLALCLLGHGSASQMFTAIQPIADTFRDG